MGRRFMAVKYIFVTGGVVSGIGKGITAASFDGFLKLGAWRYNAEV